MTPEMVSHGGDRASVITDVHRKKVAVWLFFICGMVVAMVILGGLTRLTDSGLSMVHWRPITGWLPPLTDASWGATFDAYRATPEYRKINHGMSLAEFKGIFWLEYVHRLWGRLIGVAFAVPFMVFLARGWIDRALGGRLALLFALGGAQGVLGWWMVKSGLIDRPDVSQYRLMAHLMLALGILAYGLWTALGLWHPRATRATQPAAATLRPWGSAVLALIFVTAASGALVAGLDAGLTYNTFPLMDGDWLPAGVFDGAPAWRSAFEDIMTVQFDHRVLAMTTFGSVIALWAVGRQCGLHGRVRQALGWMAVIVVTQVLLGISTLVLVVPTTLAALHQAGAVVLLMLAVWMRRELSDAAS